MHKIILESDKGLQENKTGAGGMMENELQPLSWGGDLFDTVTFERGLSNSGGDNHVELRRK